MEKTTKSQTKPERTQVWIRKEYWKQMRLLAAKTDNSLINVTDQVLRLGLAAIKKPSSSQA